MIIKKEFTFQQVLSAYPQSAKFFSAMNMSCSHCSAMGFDTLENGALLHGMDAKKLIFGLYQFLHSYPTPAHSEIHN